MITNLHTIYEISIDIDDNTVYNSIMLQFIVANTILQRSKTT